VYRIKPVSVFSILGFSVSRFSSSFRLLLLPLLSQSIPQVTHNYIHSYQSSPHHHSSIHPILQFLYILKKRPAFSY
jgi:hypothetical protein